jgi:hypothetical protein
MRLRPAILTFGLLGAAAIAGVLAASSGGGGGHARAPTARPLRTMGQALTAVPGRPLSGPAGGGSPRARLSTGQVEQGFALSYLAYLSGSLPASRLRYASTTARDQAISGGRIPDAFRDGRLTVRSVSEQGSTLYSAQATVTVANRSESYPFTVQLLRDPGGWVIAQLQAPDLRVDDHTRPLPGAVIPRAGGWAAAAFAVAYIEYRAGVRARLAGVTRTAAAQTRTGGDSLSSTRLPAEAARLLGLVSGPLESDRFSVTATVSVGRARVRFTFLMVHTPGGWKCDAFL